VDDYEYWTSFSWFGGGRMLNRRYRPDPEGPPQTPPAQVNLLSAIEGEAEG
jgi:hypothetical protein